MKWLIIGDPLEILLPATDTGLSLLREAHSRGHETHWATPGGIILNGLNVEASTQLVTESNPGAHPKTKVAKKSTKLDDFDCVWIRKDPPVDMNYISLCWLLAHAEKSTAIFTTIHREWLSTVQWIPWIRASGNSFLLIMRSALAQRRS